MGRSPHSASRGVVRHSRGESCLGKMVRKRAARREPQGGEPCGRKAKGESVAGREEKEAGESET